MHHARISPVASSARKPSKAWLAAAATAAVVVLSMAWGPATAQTSAAPTGTDPSTLGGKAPQVFDLSRAWRYMLLYDNTYQAALSEQAAAQTEIAKGRAGLLPQVAFSYSRSKLRGNVTQLNSVGNWVQSELDYDSTNGYAQLSQPLLNYGRYAAYKRGHALADQGDAMFMVRRQEAGLRLANAYFNALLAYDDLQLQKALAASLEDMAKTLEARFRKSEGTLTDVQETQARLAIARAEVIDADNHLALTTRELQSLLSIPPDHIAGLRADFPLRPLAPNNLEDWLARARVNNAEVRAAQEAVNVADTDVDLAQSRYLPTVDLVASYGKADSENLATLSQRSNTFIVGIQVNIPIFTGGYTTANVARARLDRTRLQHELNAALERAQAEVTRQYTHVEGGAERIKALEAAVESSQSTLHAALRGFEHGTWSNVDVLNAQDNLFQAKYQLAKARLEYLLARLHLQSAAGDLQGGAFDEVNDVYLGTTVPLATTN